MKNFNLTGIAPATMHFFKKVHLFFTFCSPELKTSPARTKTAPESHQKIFRQAPLNKKQAILNREKMNHF
jgi:hypothetical protein